MAKPVFIIGAAIMDLMGFPLGVPAPRDSMPGQVERAPGGVGRNLAENLVRLGLHTELITAFGDDQMGRELVKHCQQVNIGLRHSLVAEGFPTALHLAILNEQKDLHAGIADLRVLEHLTPRFLQRQYEALAEARTLVLETNVPPEAIDWLLQPEHEWEAPIYLDPVSVFLAERVRPHLGRFHTIKANRQQAEALCGRPLPRKADLEAAAREWIKKGARRVFITLGEEGAFAANIDRSVHLSALQVKVANTTGAGDAFLAGVIWATLRNWPLDDCCRAGLAASTIAVRSATAISNDLAEASLLEYIRKYC
jgi:pseudouridine kinase